jgi:uncharacterized protein (TIGR03545 family)
MSPRLKIFRWRAVGPLLLFLVLLLVLWAVFGDTLVRRGTQSSLSTLLGTEVDIASLRIRETDAAVDLGGLAIADPRDPRRNLFEAGTITVDLDPLPLTQKKLVIDRFRLSGLRFFTTRAIPARPAAPGNPAGQLLAETRAWARDKFQLPSLALGRIDTLKQLVLHPDQLQSLQTARGLAARADSVGTGFEQGLAQLQLGPLIDSSTRLVTRLTATDPRQLGLAGTQQALSAVRQAIDGVKQARTGLSQLEQASRSGLAGLQQGLRDVQAARERDYAMAQGLLQLPSLDAPNIGAALFGQASTDYFQQALYYGRVAQRYVPPGLQPWNRPGPSRIRLRGTTVEFPKEHEYPGFLLRQGQIDAAIGPTGQKQFSAAVAGITSQPSLYGRPATLSGHGRLGGEAPVDLDLAVVSRHFGDHPADSLAARVDGVDLPSIAIPSLPLSVRPGPSRVSFAFALAGEQLKGHWAVEARQAAWQADSGAPGNQSPTARLVWEVVRGLTTLQVRADLGGTIQQPTLSVHSNLDDAIAARLKALAGEALARATARARAAVDQLANQQLTALEGQLQGLTTQVTGKLPAEAGRLDEVDRRLRTELKRLAGSAIGGIQLPKP